MSVGKFWTRSREQREDNDKATVTGAMASIEPLAALDRCDRCGARAYVRILLPGGLDLMFCAHHNSQYASALAKVAAGIQDDTQQLARTAA